MARVRPKSLSTPSNITIEVKTHDTLGRHYLLEVSNDFGVWVDWAFGRRGMVV